MAAHDPTPEGAALSAVPPLKGSYPEQRRKAEAYRKLGFTSFRMLGTVLEASRPDGRTMLVYRNGDTLGWNS
jgi:hypothetical protein